MGSATQRARIWVLSAINISCQDNLASWQDKPCLAKIFHYLAKILGCLGKIFHYLAKIENYLGSDRTTTERPTQKIPICCVPSSWINPDEDAEMEPETALWAAVLNQAIRDANLLLRKVREKPALWRNHHFRSEVRHLKQFFRSRSEHPGGILFICDVVEVRYERVIQEVEQRFLRHLVPPWGDGVVPRRRPSKVSVNE